ncbi:hypothetical protein CSB07_01480 [Candidatus Gracilibacteria bacterium]|nr:MAG: hypothetical protein CSB07_01480 [Candidatus Gracilibacteria bacterium]PIE85048.1 MAG: hypothetical protein CSA08_03855 [Candidatus Gracilibacteria bacterium]
MGILKGLGLLEVLSDNELQDLEKFCQERKVLKGEKLFNEGDDANSLYFLKEGGVSIYKNVNGSEISIGEVLAEDILGEMAIFGGSGKRSATAIANQDTILIVIMSFSIKEISNKNPALLKRIQEVIEHRIMINKTILSKKGKKV